MKKGFTLIELLAVIVILAVIALITIPAVMKMIDNATRNSYRRSIDLYGGAVNNAIIEYQTDMVEKGEKTNVTFDNIEPYIEYEGNEVDCKIKQIYSDKTILLTKCYVQEELVLAEKGKGYGNENYYYYTNSKKKMKVIEYIKAVEEALNNKNINGTCTVSEDKITCNNEEISIKSNLENAISGTITIGNNKVVSYNNLKFATEKKTETNQEVPQVIDEQNTSNEEDNNQTQENIALETENYRGYYADVDGDGEVDGVIYADLAHSQSGDWGSVNNEQNANLGAYSYTAQTNLKKYTISENKYSGNFGEKEIITLKSRSSGNARFYVMALEDFREGSFDEEKDHCDQVICREGTYQWYINASGKMSTWETDTSYDFGTGYANTGRMIEIWNKNGIGEGSYSEATQDNLDIWKHIQPKYQEGWYIPSRGEWGAFADYFGITSDYDTGSYVANSGNYNSTYGLSYYYWSSSQFDSSFVWYTAFLYGTMIQHHISSKCFVRLSTTF